MKNKVKVYARAFDRKTGKAISNTRVEEVDLKENQMFTNCESVLEIKKCYEDFWNELNPHSNEIIFVQEVVV